MNANQLVCPSQEAMERRDSEWKCSVAAITLQGRTLKVTAKLPNAAVGKLALLLAGTEVTSLYLGVVTGYF
jgi:hypothetical protein